VSPLGISLFIRNEQRSHRHKLKYSLQSFTLKIGPQNTVHELIG